MNHLSPLALLLWESVLPFLITFVILHALLRKTRAIESAPALAVSLATALTLVLLHARGAYPQNFDPVNWINTALPYFGFALVLLLMALIIFAILGVELTDQLFKRVLITVIFVDLLVPDTLIIALFFGGQLPPWLDALLTPELITIIVSLSVFASLVWFVTREERTTS